LYGWPQLLQLINHVYTCLLYVLPWKRPPLH
jgi:hypothetical protein